MKVKSTKKILISLLLMVSNSFLQVNAEPKSEVSSKVNPIEEDNSNLIYSMILSLDIKVEPNSNGFVIKGVGVIENNSSFLLKDILVKNTIVDVNKNKLVDLPIKKIKTLEPNSKQPFKLETFINSKVDASEIRGSSNVDSYESISLIDIADLILNGNNKKLTDWGINSNTKNKKSMKDKAINFLLLSSKKDDSNKLLIEKADEIKLNSANEHFVKNNYHDGLLDLISMSNQGSLTSDKNDLLIKNKDKAVLINANSKISNKQYYSALKLLRSISGNSPLQKEATSEKKKIYFLSRSKKLKVEFPDLEKYSGKQRDIIDIMEEEPKTILSNSPDINLYTWVFSDYSYFVFDKENNLINYKLYSLN